MAAKAAKKVIKRRRERKNVEKGAAHIRSSFNNTMVTITDLNGNACPGLPPAVWASVVPVSPLPLLPRLLQRLLPRLQSRTAV